MNPFKSPYQLLLEEAGATPATPGLVNTPGQMLLQQANVMPHFAPGGKVFDPQGFDYDYQTALAHGMGPNGTGENQGHWGSVAPVSDDEQQLHDLPEDSYVVLKGKSHPTFYKAEAAENERGSKIVKHGDRYYSVPQNLSPEDMQASMIVNGQTPQRFATGGQSIASLYSQGAANKAAYDKELADKAKAEEAVYQNQPPVWQAIPNQDTYSIKARNAFAKQLANLTGNERWSEDTTNDIFGGGVDEPLTRSNAIPKAIKTAVQFANPISTATDIMDAPKEVASQANEGNYLGAGMTAGFTGLAALPYFKPAVKSIGPLLKKLKK